MLRSLRLKYGTSRHGWIDPKKPPLPHHTPADKRAIYENSGNYVWYEVLPNELKPLQGTQGLTARMELVFILHWGYAWLALALLLLGGAILGIGLA
ncbi:MAG: hypothetical protein H0X01_08425, partial [Nitrospira sp.]|nr:hypothetical protein [Nitrospira sp.]